MCCSETAGADSETSRPVHSGRKHRADWEKPGPRENFWGFMWNIRSQVLISSPCSLYSYFSSSSCFPTFPSRGGPHRGIEQAAAPHSHHWQGWERKQKKSVVLSFQGKVKSFSDGFIYVISFDPRNNYPVRRKAIFLTCPIPPIQLKNLRAKKVYENCPRSQDWWVQPGFPSPKMALALLLFLILGLPMTGLC